MKSNNGRYIPVIIIIALLCLVISIVTDHDGSVEKGNPEQYAASLPKEKETPDYDVKFVGVVKDVDADKQSIKVEDLEKNEEVILYYNGATDMMDEYDQKLVPGQIQLGDIVDVSYKLDDKLVALTQSKDAWEYQKINKVTIDTEDKMITVGERNYQFENTIFVTDQEEEIGLIDIHEKDEVTLRGIGNKVYAVIVTKGHGYVRFSNYSDFIGGNLEIGVNNNIPITDNMLVVSREGDYKVTMRNGDLVGTKLVHINRDEEVTIDMGEFRKKQPESGDITFTIMPEDAQLYLNGKPVEHYYPVRLKYDTYRIKVIAKGYQEYTGIVNVSESSMHFYIVLVKESVDTDDTLEDEENPLEKPDEELTEPDMESPSDSEASDQEEEKDNEDSQHKLYIQSPKGANVYVNGKAKGEVPVAITKQTGNITVTFSRDGYQTMSYPIHVADDKQDLYLNFPDLLKNNAN